MGGGEMKMMDVGETVMLCRGRDMFGLQFKKV